MSLEEIKELAKSDPSYTKTELDLKLTKLKSKGYDILDCIMYVKCNQSCSLLEAKSIVVNSSSWIDQKEEFMKHQQEQMNEFLEAAKDDIQSIHHTYTLDSTEVKIIMKRTS